MMIFNVPWVVAQLYSAVYSDTCNENTNPNLKMGDREEEETHCWTLQASRHKMARRRLRLDWRTMRPASSGGSTRFSFFAMKRSTSRICQITNHSWLCWYLKHNHWTESENWFQTHIATAPKCFEWACMPTSSLEGALILMLRHRDRTASITFEALLQHRTRRHAALYFSIVRRRECCASFDNLSTSFRTSTGVNDKTKHKQHIRCKLRTNPPFSNLVWGLIPAV